MHSHRRPFREHFAATRPEKYFRWRGREVSRVEGFADAVFAFAVTLLIVALEVPHTFAGLMDAIRGFPAFVVCFVFLMLFWNGHYRYFRRYGLEDKTTRFVTLAILLLVLFSVYPLKFLFGAILSFGAPHAPHIETMEQLKFIYLVYGLGFASVWGLYSWLESHAISLGDHLRFTPAESLIARESLWSYRINVAVCLFSVALSRLEVPPAAPGYIYAALGPLLTANGWWHGRLVRRATEGDRPARGDRD